MVDHTGPPWGLRRIAGGRQREIHSYLAHLAGDRSYTERLCGSGVRAWVVFGERDEVRLADEERRALEACPGVELITIADATHLTLVERPDQVAKLIVRAAGMEGP